MKLPLPIKVYADFECFNQPQKDPNQPKVLFEQIPIAVGFYLISPIGYHYYSNSGLDSVSWFVRRVLTLKKKANKYFKKNIPLLLKSEEEAQFQDSTTCWLCEEIF